MLAEEAVWAVLVGLSMNESCGWEDMDGKRRGR